MKRIIKTNTYEASLVSMNARKKTCRIKIHYFGNDFSCIYDYSLYEEFSYFSRYATEHDWKVFLLSAGCLNVVYVKSTKM